MLQLSCLSYLSLLPLLTFTHLQKLRPWQTVPDVLPDSSTDLDQTLRFRAPTLTPIDSSDDEDDRTNGSNSAVYTSPTKMAQGQRPPALQLSPGPHSAKQLSLLAGGDHLSPWLLGTHHNSTAQPSPIPHHMVNRSLKISGAPTAVPAPGYFPIQSPIANEPQPVPHVMEDVAFHREGPPTARLPSPVSDDDATMGSGYKTPTEDAEMTYSPCQTSPAHGFDQNAVPSTEAAGQYSRQTHGDLMKHAALSPSVHRKKPALVMGYRADCEKCRCRVPGHYSHIIRT